MTNSMNLNLIKTLVKENRYLLCSSISVEFEEKFKNLRFRISDELEFPPHSLCCPLFAVVINTEWGHLVSTIRP